MPNPYRQDSICKPHIFQRADLVNTEIIITISPNPLIKSAQSIGTFERRFIHCCSLHRSSNDLYSFMGRSCATLQSFQKRLSFCLLFPFTLWRGSFYPNRYIFAQMPQFSKPPHTLLPTVPPQPLYMSYNNSYKFLN